MELNIFGKKKEMDEREKLDELGKRSVGGEVMLRHLKCISPKKDFTVKVKCEGCGKQLERKLSALKKRERLMYEGGEIVENSIWRGVKSEQTYRKIIILSVVCDKCGYEKDLYYIKTNEFERAYDITCV